MGNQITAEFVKNSLIGSYQHLGRKGRFIVILFLVMLPIFIAKTFLQNIGREEFDKQVLEHCKRVDAKKEKEAYDGEYVLTCKDVLTKAGLKTHIHTMFD